MKYVKYCVKRLLIILLTLLIVSFVVFVLLRISKQDPLVTIMGNRSTDEATKELVREEYGLNDPIIVQYKNWLVGLLHGDFGISYDSKRPVADEINERIPVTLALVGISMGLAIIIAIPLGIICAFHKNKALDHIISTILLIFSSTPSFLMALILLVVVSKLMPNYQISGSYTNTAEFFSRVSVPAICLALFMVALLCRIMRSSVIEQMKQNYMMTAKAKGISKREMIWKHLIPNSIIPVLTIAATMVGTGISGAILVESVFSLPGLGSLLLEAVQTYNHPIIQIIVLIVLALFLLISFLVDILYMVIDPRLAI